MLTKTDFKNVHIWAASKLILDSFIKSDVKMPQQAVEALFELSLLAVKDMEHLRQVGGETVIQESVYIEFLQILDKKMKKFKEKNITFKDILNLNLNVQTETSKSTLIEEA